MQLSANWQKHIDEIDDQLKALEIIRRKIGPITDANARTYALAATNLYVERAQKFITLRGRLLLGMGVLLSASILALLYETAVYIVKSFDLEKLPDEWPQAILVLFHSISISAVALIGAYFLASIARACLHEGIALFQRRHALRFGRLYVYLKKGEIDFKELDAAFQWHEGVDTAFRDIKLDAFTRTLLHKFLETMPELVAAIRGVGRPSTPTENAAPSPAPAAAPVPTQPQTPSVP